ncbi:MAG: ribosome biogenesis GTPase Der [Armatimonadetes bacterium]|nr:ribosome biogenesis GTPase Der [Armatimonadota bacterium]
MAARPIVAIVGRTNVGKSSLFNRLARRRLAVVADTEGITRDRIYADVDLDGHSVVLVDTGGLATSSEDELFSKVREHAIAALQQADAIIFVVDAREGLVSLDYEVAETVRRTGKPVVLVANKAEKPNRELSDFSRLGFGDPIPVSAIHGLGIGELVEALVEILPKEPPGEEEPEADVAVAIVGRPNAGKSSILNALVGEERAIVSPQPGTTRDAIDTVVELQGRKFLLVDTAGVRRKFKRAVGVDYYAALRALRAIERADVAVLVMDASEGVTSQDVRLARETVELGRGLVLCAHKWDLLLAEAGTSEEHLKPSERRRREKLLEQDYAKMVRSRMPLVADAPLLFTSVVTGQGIEDIMPTAAAVADGVKRRVETGQINRTIRRVDDGVLRAVPNAEAAGGALRSWCAGEACRQRASQEKPTRRASTGGKLSHGRGRAVCCCCLPAGGHTCWAFDCAIQGR